jgi:tetratricopeptide (TPR) repeat protein
LAGLAVGIVVYALRPVRAADTGLPSVNAAAYDAVLRARYLSVRTTDADTQAAIALLERAVGLDPGFARAYADLAAAYITRLTFVTPEETGDLEQKAFAAAEKALLLDPNLAEAYLARGDLLWTHSHHFAHERAVQEFRRAVELNPKSDQAHRRLARVYVHVGFFEEALQHAAVALAINPSNAQALNSRAQALLWMGKDEEALAILQSIPGPVLPELVEANIAFALLRLGRREEAWAELRKALRKYPNDPSGGLPGIEAMLLAESEPLKAQALIEQVAQRKAINPSHHAAYFAASAWALMGRAEEAIQWLREAAQTGFPCYALFARDANLDRIRQDSRFQAFLAEMEKQSGSLRKALFP